MVPMSGGQRATAVRGLGSGRAVLKPLERDTLRDSVVRAIRDAIIQGRLHPGEKVPEEDLAQQLQVSRTPIREAIRVLESQGLVVVRPKRGTYIAMPDRDDAADGLAVRTSLEVLAVEQAMERLDEGDWEKLCGRLEGILAEMATAQEDGDAIRAVELDIDFHATLIKAGRNRHLWRSWDAIGIPFLVWTPERGMYPSAETDVAARHRSLFVAIRSRDATLAAAAVRSHIARKLADIPG